MQFYSLFVSYRGRIGRGTFCSCSILIWSLFFAAFILTDIALGFKATLALYPFVIWTSFAVSAKRMHDTGASSKNLAWLALPLVGPLYVGIRLIFKRSQESENRYGVPLEIEQIDYATTGISVRSSDGTFIVDDVTKLNAISVKDLFCPKTQAELIDFVTNSKDRLSIGGGRFSMGGQTASPNTTHIDMRSLNRIVTLSPQTKVVRVEAGIRWCDLQKFLDHHDLSIATMQTYANFTVGGSIGVNCHGRYVGQGPVSLSVRSIKVLFADGSVKECNTHENQDLFHGMLGGYGALGIVLDVELNLASNIAIERHSLRMPLNHYHQYFFSKVKADKNSIFHNGDIYPPHYSRVNAVTWKETKKPINFPSRLLPIQKRYPINRVFFWIFSQTQYGKWLRERIVDPLLFSSANIRWRNREASYDVAELEPVDRSKTTYVLQEYFIPVQYFDSFVPKMAEIFRRHKVNCINVSIRHAESDPRPLLSWAPAEVFAFVVYYKQGVSEEDKEAVGVWTREMIDAAAEFGGTYYLPYQPHASQEQFHRTYPRAKDLFILKKKLDPSFRFHNCLWDKYYSFWLSQSGGQISENNKGAQS